MGVIIKFFKFCIVGGSGVFVDFTITFICKELLKLNKYVANSTGFIVAASTNYMLNRLWTFHSKDPQWLIEYIKFIAFSLIGLAINNLIIFLINDKWKINLIRLLPDKLKKDKLNFYCAKLIAIVIVTLWNFFMNYFFNFQ